MSLVLFTCMVGLLIAPINVDLTSACISLLAVAIGSGAAGTLNMWYDADGSGGSSGSGSGVVSDGDSGNLLNPVNPKKW